MTLRKRRSAVAHWLLNAAEDVSAARNQWRDYGVALLACGSFFSALRAPAFLVWAAIAPEKLREAGDPRSNVTTPVYLPGTAASHLPDMAASSEELREVDERLRVCLDGGAAFMDLGSLLYYFLLPPPVVWVGSEREFPGVAGLGRNHFLGVPEVRLTEPRGRSYWCVPMDTPGGLCPPSEVAALLQRGRTARMRETPGGR